MVRKIVAVLSLALSTMSFGQTDYIQPGVLKASATISPSSMLGRSVGNIYMSGFLEYHTDKKLSLRGETFFFIDGQSKNGTNNEFIRQGMRTYFGAFYHWNKNNWDKYIGLQPGLAMMRPLNSIQADAPLQACPSFAIHAGSSYYIWKYFHFFVDLAYVKSSYRGLLTGSVNTDEMIISAGLGLQVATKKH